MIKEANMQADGTGICSTFYKISVEDKLRRFASLVLSVETTELTPAKIKVGIQPPGLG